MADTLCFIKAELFSFFALPSLLLQMSPYAEVMLTLARGCPPLDSSMHRLQIPKIFNANDTGVLRNGGLERILDRSIMRPVRASVTRDVRRCGKDCFVAAILQGA